MNKKDLIKKLLECAKKINSKSRSSRGEFMVANSNLSKIIRNLEKKKEKRIKKIKKIFK